MPEYSCGDPDYDSTGRDIFCDHTASADYCIVANGHALENNGPRTNPDPIFNGYGRRHQAQTWQRVLIGVHDNDVSCDLTVAANCDTLCRHNLGVAIQIRSVADANHRALPAFEPDAREETAVFDFDPPGILNTREREATGDDDNARALKTASKPEAENVRQYSRGAKPAADTLNHRRATHRRHHS